MRLASQLSGWDIDIMTEAEESERRQEEVRVRSQLFIEALDVDDVIARLLVAEGFTSVEEVAYIPIEELAGIEGFDADIAEELRGRGRRWLDEQNAIFEARRKELEVTDELAAAEGVNPAMLVVLGEGGIKTLDNLADLDNDELMKLLPPNTVTTEDANRIIMAARAHWFEDEDAAPAETEAAAEGDAEATDGDAEATDGKE